MSAFPRLFHRPVRPAGVSTSAARLDVGSRRLRLLAVLLLGSPLLASCGDGGQGVEDATPPHPAPSNVTATVVLPTAVQVTWRDNSRNEEEFRVERDGSEGEGAGPLFVTVATLDADVTTFRDDNLDPLTVYRYRVTACNPWGCIESANVAQVVTPALPPEIITSELPTGVVGQAYGAQLETELGDGDDAWALIAGVMPDGLALAGGTGVISGTPTKEGTFDFTVEVTDNAGTDTADLTITINAGAISFPNTFVAMGYSGLAYSETVTATGGTGTFTYAETAGTLPPGLALNTNTGEISGSPTTPGMYFFRITATSGESVTTQFTITVSTAGPDAFNMNGFDVSGTMPSAALQTAINDALARWEEIITGDVGVPIPLSTVSEENCGGFGQRLNGHSVEDMVVMVNIAPLDGFLGVAAACFVRAGKTLFGRFALDSERVDLLTPAKRLSLVMHEIAHVVGFGTRWDRSGNSFTTGKVTEAGGDPRYVGPDGSVAVSEYKGTLGGQDDDIPLENTGGKGTLNGHWRESAFDDELMTGYAESGDEPNPLSTMTIGAIADLGFTVDPGAADAYSCPGECAPPPPGVAPLQSEDRQPWDIVLNEPIMVLEPDGTIRIVPPRGLPSGR